MEHTRCTGNRIGDGRKSGKLCCTIMEGMNMGGLMQCYLYDMAGISFTRSCASRDDLHRVRLAHML